MRCTICGNTRHFFVTGKEVRRIDTADPYEVETFFVPTQAACNNPNCAQYGHPGDYVELTPLHQDLVPFIRVLDLPSR